MPCHRCGEAAKYRCPCRTVHYCGRECQAVDRRRHRPECLPSAPFASSAAMAPLTQYHRNFSACRNSSTECAVCLEELDGEISTLACGHRFHTACMPTDAYRCPMCRAFVSPSRGEGRPFSESSPDEVLGTMLRFAFLSAADTDPKDTMREAAAWADARLSAADHHPRNLAARAIAAAGQPAAAGQLTDLQVVVNTMVTAAGLLIGEDLPRYAPHVSRWLHDLFL